MRVNQFQREKQLLKFLLDPNSYSHQPKQVQLVQTHSSFVILSRPFVFKIKKPVNFGFLDYSTLGKRRYFCQREVELNRRLAPKMYLGVVPISKHHGLFQFAPGRIVEVAVCMRKLPERCFLDKLLESGRVRPADLDRVASTLRDFYLAQHPTAEIEAWGQIDRLKISTNENFEQTKPFIGHTLSQPAHQTIEFYTDQFYKHRAELFESRIHDRWIRDCHGDLRLDHVHLTAQSLQIFDCIEFNDRLRYIDVANDIAFLAMDLDRKGHPALARHFARRMSSELRDPRLCELLDFYKCYRACVRGKVESLHSIAKTAPRSEREASAARARSYFQLALNYAVAGSEPLLLAVIGRIGSGKSTLAQSLARELGSALFSSDRIRKDLGSVPLYQRSNPSARARLYSRSMTEKTYGRMLTAALAELRQGRNAILDATFGNRTHRQQLRTRLAAEGLAFRFLEVQADDPAIKERLRDRETKTDQISDARLEDFDTLTGRYQPPTELPGHEFVKVTTLTPQDQTVAAALQSLVSVRFSRAKKT